MFNAAKFQQHRQGKFGDDFRYFEKLDSTNRLAEQLAREGAKEGTIVLTDEQTEGKGRKGNAWFSPAEENLYFTIVLRPPETRLHYLPFLAGLAVVRVLHSHRIPAELKWPNDIVVKEKKICGLLIQTAIEHNRLQFAVLGCGLNVNTKSFPADLLDSATSILNIKGETVEREALLSRLLLEFEKLYERIQALPWSDLIKEVESASTILRDCEVVIREQGNEVRGVTQGLDSFGGLIVRAEDGSRTFYAGDIQSCRKK